MLGEQYNLISFDPRGVNNSGPSLDCFSENAEARLAFNRLHSTGATNVSSASHRVQYYSSSIYGEWCNNAVDNESPHAYYVTTPAVAHDLLTFIEAEAPVVGQLPSDARLWCYGISYGTVIGTTFASMFPNRVGRMILDGVLDAEQYYDNDWREAIPIKWMGPWKNSRASAIPQVLKSVPSGDPRQLISRPEWMALSTSFGIIQCR